MEFKFSVNDIFKSPVVEISHNLIPPGFTGDRRAYWDALGKVSEVINAMGEASAAAQGLTKPITTSERLRNSEQKIYLLTDPSANNGRGAVTGMLKVGKKSLYVFDRNGQHYQVSPPCVLDFYIHESRQRTGLGKRLFEHMLQTENIEPVKMAIDRPSDKFLGFLNKHYTLNEPVKQMNNYVVFDGFFPNTPEKNGTVEVSNSGGTPGKKQSANGLQSGNYAPLGRYGAPRPPCSMGQIIHNQSSTIPKNPEPTGVTGVRSAPETNYHAMSGNSPTNPANVSQSVPNMPYQSPQQQQNVSMVQNQQPPYQSQYNGLYDGNNANQYQTNQVNYPQQYQNTQYQENPYANNPQMQTGQYQNEMQPMYSTQVGENNMPQKMYQNTQQPVVNSQMQNPDMTTNQEYYAPQPQTIAQNPNQYTAQVTDQTYTTNVATDGQYVQQQYTNESQKYNMAPDNTAYVQNNAQNQVPQYYPPNVTQDQLAPVQNTNYLQTNPQNQAIVQPSLYQPVQIPQPVISQPQSISYSQPLPYATYSTPQTLVPNAPSYVDNAKIQPQPYLTQSMPITNTEYAQNTQSYVTNPNIQSQPNLVQSVPNTNAGYVQNTQPYVNTANIQSQPNLVPSVPGTHAAYVQNTTSYVNNPNIQPNLVQSAPNTNVGYVQNAQPYLTNPNVQSQPNLPANMPTTAYIPSQQTSQPIISANQAIVSSGQNIAPQANMTPNTIEGGNMQQMNVNPPQNEPQPTTTTSQPNTNVEKNVVEQHQNQTVVNQSQNNVKETLPKQRISSAKPINQNIINPDVPQHMEGNQFDKPPVMQETRVHDDKGDMPPSKYEDVNIEHGYPPQIIPNDFKNERRPTRLPLFYSYIRGR